jgi:hypothetical protein
MPVKRDWKAAKGFPQFRQAGDVLGFESHTTYSLIPFGVAPLQMIRPKLKLSEGHQ